MTFGGTLQQVIPVNVKGVVNAQLRLGWTKVNPHHLLHLSQRTNKELILTLPLLQDAHQLLEEVSKDVFDLSSEDMEFTKIYCPYASARPDVKHSVHYIWEGSQSQFRR